MAMAVVDNSSLQVDSQPKAWSEGWHQMNRVNSHNDLVVVMTAL